MLYTLSENCNTWNTKNFDTHLDLDLQCTVCSAFDVFSLVQKYFIWRWEIHIPYDWKHGEWDKIKLSPVQVPILIAKCDLCNKIYRVYPSFIIAGTTLTLSALAFVIYAYESSDLTWREIPILFCSDEHNRIAHSTLYKAVHGFANSIPKIKEALEKLNNHYFPSLVDQVVTKVWPSEKSRYTHTLDREASLRNMLSFFVYQIQKFGDFSQMFFTYLRQLRNVFSELSPLVGKLY